MRCLIVGGNGMLGHQLLRSWQSRHDVRATVRGPLHRYSSSGVLHAGNTFAGIEVQAAPAEGQTPLQRVLQEFRPQVVVNAVGVIKQRDAARDPLPCLEINAVFPHRLADWCEEIGARLIHLSTDCVFDGTRGNSTTADRPTAYDRYGLSKFLGEVQRPTAVTLRTSIIGLELEQKRSLVEWFLAQRGTIRGFRRAIYSGFTTLEMARVIELVMTECPDLHGLWQVASTPISKFDLLSRLQQLLDRRDVQIEPDDEFCCDRSLCGLAFAERTGYQAPTWDQMLSELAVEISSRGIQHDAA